MNLLEMAKRVATSVGLDRPTSAQSDDLDNEKIVQFINETGKELKRRVDWTALTKSHSVTVFDGDGFGALATDHDRFVRGLAIKVSGVGLRGSLSADEWNSLPTSTGTPRFYRVAGTRVGFFPKPSSGLSASVNYQSRFWALDNTDAGKEEMGQNEDVPLIPDELLIKGAVWRFQRHVGKDFADHVAEFETMLADLATGEGGVRQP